MVSPLPISRAAGKHIFLVFAGIFVPTSLSHVTICQCFFSLFCDFLSQLNTIPWRTLHGSAQGVLGLFNAEMLFQSLLGLQLIPPVFFGWIRLLCSLMHRECQ